VSACALVTGPNLAQRTFLQKSGKS
jgi:hypothetical protein